MRRSGIYAACCWHLADQAVLGLPLANCMASDQSFHLACEIMAKGFSHIDNKAVTTVNPQLSAMILLPITSKTIMKVKHSLSAGFF